MKIIIKNTILLIMASLILSGCTASCEAQNKRNKAAIFGLHKKITLYSGSGQVIRTWETKAQGEDKGGTYNFLDANGKSVTVSGVFIVEEL